jgi:hypothetical protein
MIWFSDGRRLLAAAIVLVVLVAVWMFRFENLNTAIHRNRITGAVCEIKQRVLVLQLRQMKCIACDTFAAASAPLVGARFISANLPHQHRNLGAGELLGLSFGNGTVTEPTRIWGDIAAPPHNEPARLLDLGKDAELARSAASQSRGR